MILGGYLLVRSPAAEVALENTLEPDSLQTTGVAGETTDNPGLPSEPDFELALTDTINADEGISFDANRGVASFRDTIRGVKVTVSQQKLTEGQKIDRAAQTELVAVQLLASTSLESDIGTVYLTDPTGQADPSQTAIFSTDELLIFVRTQGVVLAPQAWLEYANSIDVNQ
jgi:hypothetical protein